MSAVIIAQLLLPGASAYERKSQAIDAAALSADHDVRIGSADGADIVHIYAPRVLDPAAVRGITAPFVSNARLSIGRWHWRKPPRPARVISPLKETPDTFIPEAVDDHYFDPGSRQAVGRATIGTFSRASVRNIVEQTATRIHRFRDDVDWLLFDEAPALADLHAVDLWVDPALEDDDYDGLVAEALAAGIAVVASRTSINTQRIEKGRTGGLVPPNDPNELTHAILAALFKPELRLKWSAASQQTVAKFRVRHRLRALIQLYETILQ
ncbi:MAG: hypothetical protein QOK37_3315 [Thermoanaerobaculia bacterium]|jgi:glycosyltransferase involved in cell wall biosynthesis|nr:hypothetical protein [Thermoanaerobaculia bacterium]